MLYRPLLLLALLAPSACSGAEILMDASTLDGSIAIDAMVSDADGLESANLTIYSGSSAVLTERRDLSGTKENVSFFWPGMIWRAVNDTHFVEPVIVVNSTGPVGDEASLLVYSAPCLLSVGPGAPETPAVAYFDANGTFHSLRDLTGREHYRSRELLSAVSPGASYWRYLKENATLQVGASYLRMLGLHMEAGLQPMPPLLLDRSPIQHYSLALVRRKADPGPYTAVMAVEDRGHEMSVSSLEVRLE